MATAAGKYKQIQTIYYIPTDTICHVNEYQCLQNIIKWKYKKNNKKYRETYFVRRI